MTGVQEAVVPRGRRVTIKEVAQRAGVSPATVSNVLGGRGSGRSSGSAETRRKVQEAAELLGYRPNRAARGARTGRAGTLLLALSNLEDPWVTSVIRASQAHAERVGLTPLVLPGDDWYDVALSLPMDAIFVSQPDAALEPSERLQTLARQGSRVIAFSDHLMPDGFDVVSNSAEHAARLAAAHFLSQSQNVALIGIDEFSTGEVVSARERAFIDEARRFGVSKPRVLRGSPQQVMDDFLACDAQCVVADRVGSAITFYLEAIRRGLDMPHQAQLLALGNVADSIARWAPISYVGVPGMFERLAEIIVQRAADTGGRPARYELMNQVVHHATTLPPDPRGPTVTPPSGRGSTPLQQGTNR